MGRVVSAEADAKEYCYAFTNSPSQQTKFCGLLTAGAVPFPGLCFLISKVKIIRDQKGLL